MPCNASYARFIFGKFFTSTIILYVLLFAQKVLFLQKVGVTPTHSQLDESVESPLYLLHQLVHQTSFKHILRHAVPI
jgi:hypothetical protein